jgi:hypothetical protein
VNPTQINNVSSSSVLEFDGRLRGRFPFNDLQICRHQQLLPSNIWFYRWSYIRSYSAKKKKYQNKICEIDMVEIILSFQCCRICEMGTNLLNRRVCRIGPTGNESDICRRKLCGCLVALMLDKEVLHSACFIERREYYFSYPC